MTKHTPTPWKMDDKNGILSENGKVIATTRMRNRNYDPCWANQEFIVRAVNSHYQLLQACKEALTIVDLTSSAVFGNSETFKASIQHLKEAIKIAESDSHAQRIDRV
jgi:hypothetical protein